MGDFAFCSTFTEDYKLFLEKIENGTLTEEELIEFDKKIWLQIRIHLLCRSNA